MNLLPNYADLGGNSVLDLEIELGAHIFSVGGEWFTDGDPKIAQMRLDAYPGSATELQFHRDQKLAALIEIVVTKFDAGRAYNGKVWQIDEVSQGRLTAVGTLAGFANVFPSSVAWPDGGYPWIAADNTQARFSPAEMFAFAQNVAGYIAGLVLTSRAFKDSIAAAPDVKTVAAINITQGWPANGD